MLKVPIYIYETGCTIYSDLDATVRQGYAPMYQQRLKLYKGVTNTIKFTVKNQDQKPVDINGETFTFTLIDSENGATFLSKKLTVLDDGSTRSTKGVCQIILSESDTATINSRYYTYSISQTSAGSQKPVFTNTYYSAAGDIELVDAVYAPFAKSTTLDTFTGVTDTDDSTIVRYSSSHVDAVAEYKRSNPIHTVAYYTTGYNGSFIVQGTLDAQPSNDTSWVDLKTVTLSNSSGVAYENVSGVYSWLRIQHIPTNSNTGTLDKVLVRS